jgi:TrmH family RNA methyltransferase
MSDPAAESAPPLRRNGALDRTVVILVEPLQPGNVGAAARAMKNMGLSRLTLVAPPAYDPQRARWMAPGCDELLADARIVDTLDEALEDVHVAWATTARHRKRGGPVLTERGVAGAVFDTPEQVVTGILFGREDHGLDAESIDRCQGVLRIPTPEHASLNLAQAVLLVCHALFEEAVQRGFEPTGRYIGGHGTPKPTSQLKKRDHRDELASLSAIEPAVDELVRLLERVGYTKAANPKKVAATGRRTLQKAHVSFKDVDALRGMVSRIEWALDNPDADWTAPRRR